jgi:hypothetical protein
MRLLSEAAPKPPPARWYGARVTPFRNGAAALVLVTVTAFAGCGDSTTKTVTQTTSAPATATTPKSCGTAAGNFITRLQAAGLDCPTAKRVALAWLHRVQKGADPHKPISVSVDRSYRCAARFRGQVATAACDPGRITFTAHP